MADQIRKRVKPRATYRNGMWTVQHGNLSSTASTVPSAVDGFRIAMRVQQNHNAQIGKLHFVEQRV